MKRSTYLGRYFHTWTQDEVGREIIQYQGVVIADDAARQRVVVQLFSFYDGAENGEPMTVEYRQFMEHERWTWYRSSAQMNSVYYREAEYRWHTEAGRTSKAPLY